MNKLVFALGIVTILSLTGCGALSQTNNQAQSSQVVNIPAATDPATQVKQGEAMVQAAAKQFTYDDQNNLSIDLSRNDMLGILIGQSDQEIGLLKQQNADLETQNKLLQQLLAAKK